MPHYPAFLNPVVCGLLEASSLRRGVRRGMGGEWFRVSARFRWIINDTYEPAVRDFIRRHAGPEERVLDIGSHVGVYVLWFSRCSPGALVHAFEPNPETRRLLQRHVRLNGLGDRVIVQPYAVSDRQGDAPFSARPGDGMSRLGSENPLLRGQAHLIRVHTIGLDQYCAEQSLAPTWLRVDVEGYEIAVLRGASRTIREGRGRLKTLVEMHPSAWASAGTSRDEAERCLRELELRPTPITGQTDPLGEYGIVALEYI